MTKDSAPALPPLPRHLHSRNSGSFAPLYTADQMREYAASVLEEAARVAEADAARYRWLRDGNAYKPEEEFVRGGDDLDALCDAGIRALGPK
jgi:hypothetical protein